MSVEGNPFGFDWGPLSVTRLTHVEGRGRVLEVKTAHRTLQVYVSEAGRSLRVFVVGGNELLEAPDER